METETIEKLLNSEGKLSPVDAKLAARLAFGSVGQALSIDPEKLKPQRELLLRVLQAAIEDQDRVSLLQAAEKLNDAKNKDNFEANLEILLTLIRDVWTLALGGDDEKTINIDLSPQLKHLAAIAETRRLAGWIDEIELIRESLAVNINKKIATDAFFVSMAADKLLPV